MMTGYKISRADSSRIAAERKCLSQAASSPEAAESAVAAPANDYHVGVAAGVYE